MDIIANNGPWITLGYFNNSHEKTAYIDNGMFAKISYY